MSGTSPIAPDRWNPPPIVDAMPGPDDGPGSWRHPLLRRYGSDPIQAQVEPSPMHHDAEWKTAKLPTWLQTTLTKCGGGKCKPIRYHEHPTPRLAEHPRISIRSWAHPVFEYVVPWLIMLTIIGVGLAWLSGWLGVGKGNNVLDTSNPEGIAITHVA